MPRHHRVVGGKNVDPVEAEALRLHKPGVLDNVAKMTTFLAADGASHVLGQMVSVSGGYSVV